MAGKLSGGAIQSGTITTTQISSALNTTISAGGGPKISTIIYPGDDTAANTNGGQTLYLTGSGFKSNSTVYINGNNVPSVSFISASNLSFTGPVLSAATYPVYVINPEDGATAILIPGILISGEPTWVTGATLAEQDATATWNISLSATGDTPLTYALAAGSSLPGGITLASNGTISGTITTPPETDTTYNFTVDVTDAQNQSSSRAFSVTATTGEGILFANNVLLIHADGTNNGNNHSFLDSSNNNFTITRVGNATQGSYSPFSQTGWSAYFDGSGDSLLVPLSTNLAFGTGDFTIECWIYFTSVSIANQGFYSMIDDTNDAWTGVRFNANSSTFQVVSYVGGALEHTISHQTALQANKWHHCAVTRSGTTMRIFLDGVVGSTTATTSTNYGQSGSTIGSAYPGAAPFAGYISNLRVIKGAAQYTTTFTVPNTPFAPIANTQLLTLQSNRFIDEGPNNFAITRNGDVSVQPFSPFVSGLLSSNSYSVYFDGTGDYLNTPANAALTFGTGDLTLECWIYQTATSASTYRVIFADDVYGSVGGYTLYSYNNALNLWKGSAGGGAEVIAPAGTINLNTWTHVAWTRSGSSNKLFINGTQVGNTTTDSTNYTSNTVYIAANKLGTFPFAGYISNARIVKGTAVHTANFTPSTTPLTAISNTSLLTCQSTTFIDNSTNGFTITRNGDAAPSKFNPFGQTFSANVAYSTANVSGSIFFDGSGDRLTLPSSSNLAFGAGDFCVEAWVYFNANPASMMIFTNIADSETQFAFRIDASGYPKVQSWFTNYAISSVTVTTNQWYHLVACRVSNTLSIFINGTRRATATVTNNFSSTNAFTIGGTGNDFSGFMSNLRVIKGSSPYNPTHTSITVPNDPVTAIANTQLLCNFTNAQIFDQTAKNVLETVGDAKVSTAQYKYGTGSITFDGTGDYLSIPSNNLFDFGTGEFTIEAWVYRAQTAASQVIVDARNLDILGPYVFNIQANNKLDFIYSTSSPNRLMSSGTVAVNSWSHVAVSRGGGVLRMFINGNLEGNVTTSASITGNAATALWIGGGRADGSGNPGYYFNGYIDDLRITKGYARYTANFTAPTAKFKDK